MGSPSTSLWYCLPYPQSWHRNHHHHLPAIFPWKDGRPGNAGFGLALPQENRKLRQPYRFSSRTFHPPLFNPLGTALAAPSISRPRETHFTFREHTTATITCSREQILPLPHYFLY